MATSAELICPSSAIVTSPYEWKIPKWDEKPQTVETSTLIGYIMNMDYNRITLRNRKNWHVDYFIEQW